MKKLEKRVCLDCGCEIPRCVGRGRGPVRCTPCATVRNRKKEAEWRQSEKGREATRSSALRKVQVCKQCGANFHALGKRAMCSKKCLEDFEQSQKRVSVCGKCGKTFHPRHAKYWQYCSRECAYADIKTWYSANNADSVRYARISIKPCVVCGRLFTGRSLSDITCVGCADKLHAHNIVREKRPGKTHIRRAKILGVEFERFDPLVIFERDGWVCQICGISTPVSKRGTYDDDAPELDHILPMTKGGAHTVANSQCACKRCNIAKGNKSDTLRP